MKSDVSNRKVTKHVIGVLHMISERKDISESEELILNCVATVNNLSYYTTKQESLLPQHKAIAECECTAPWGIRRS